MNLLIALQENPLSSDSALANIMGVSQPTATSRLRELKEKVSIYNIHCDLDCDALGLELIDVILDIPNGPALEFCEKICKEHPYTLYRTRQYGKTSGLFIQFRIPLNSKKYIIDLIELLKEKKIISNFRIPKRSQNAPPTPYSRSKLSAWDPKTMRWEFDWENWIPDLESQSSVFPPFIQTDCILDNLSGMDIHQLSEMTQDARQKNTDIMRKLSYDIYEPGLPQKVSRRLKFLKEKVVTGYRVFLNWEVFDTYHTFAFICKATKEQTAQLYNQLSDKPIPFYSTFTILDDGYLWSVQAPPSHFSNIGKITWDYSEERELLILDYKTSDTYGLWAETYDSLSHSWRKTIMNPEKIMKEFDNPV